MCPNLLLFFLFFFTDPPTTEIYTLSLHDALPISHRIAVVLDDVDHRQLPQLGHVEALVDLALVGGRSEEHTSELQSRGHLVCRLLLEKKKTDQPCRNNRRLEAGF